MKRIRNLGLAVVTALALAGIGGAGAASATSGFEAQQYPAAVTSSGSGGDEQDLSFKGFVTGCWIPVFEVELKEPSEAITASPGKTPCSFSYLQFNGCSLTFHPPATGTGAGTFDIGPAGCGPITVSFSTYCTAAIGAQSGLAAKYENTGTGSGSKVRITPEINNLTYTQVSGWGCEHKTYTDGGWTGAAWEVKASYAGSATGLRATAQLRNHIAIVNGSPPQFVADEYPVSLAGSQVGTELTLGFQSGTTSCAKVQFSGEETEETDHVALNATQSGCVGVFLPTAVKMNGCQYLFYLMVGFGDTYFGEATINCPEGKAIEIIINSSPGAKVKCTITIPGQDPVSVEDLVIEDDMWGGLDIGVDIGGIKYHQQEGEGLAKCKTGDFTNGTYKGSINLTGVF